MKWGIIGHGEIAPKFIESLENSEGEKLYAIASRSQHLMLSKMNKYPGVLICSDYHDLFSYSDVDIVYLCTVNPLHKDNALHAIKYGKHVLCEKPMCVCEEDTREMITAARKNNLFLMEGMWTRFLPAYREFIKIIRSGELGIPKLIRIDFGFKSNWGPERRLLNKDLYGGAILDNTDYNIFLCQDVYGDLPITIQALGKITNTGVEESCAVQMFYSEGRIAQVYSGYNLETKQEAIIYCTKGYIKMIHFWRGTKILVKKNDEEEKAYEYPYRNTGFVHEIEEVVACIKEGKQESSTVPHKLSIEVAGIMDEILRQVRK